MSELVPYQQSLMSAKDDWQKISAEAKTSLSFTIEQQFALEAMTRNSYLFDVAQKNPQSLYNAMTKVAAVGLSLNSATQYAYLVPRSRKVNKQYIPEVCLDISYKGLLKIATDTGSIKWAQAEIVREGDTFNYKGPCEKPEHICNPFSGDRGKYIGVYCIAKTVEDDYIVEIMTEAECMEVAAKSEAFKKNMGPWSEFGGEMRKKAVIKRASKTWPKTEVSERIQFAVDTLNEHEGIDFDRPTAKKGRTTLDAYNSNYSSIVSIRDAYKDGDYNYAVQCWDEITGDPDGNINWGEDDKSLLNVAPSKFEQYGLPEPIFSTEIRKFLKEEANKYRG